MAGIPVSLDDSDIDRIAARILASLPAIQSLPRSYSVQAVADLLDDSKEHVRAMIRSGELSAFRVGGKLRVTEDSIRALHRSTTV